MLQREHSAILLTSIKLPFVIKIFALSIFEWPIYTNYTVPKSHVLAHADDLSPFYTSSEGSGESAPANTARVYNHRCVESTLSKMLQEHFSR